MSDYGGDDYGGGGDTYVSSSGQMLSKCSIEIQNRYEDPYEPTFDEEEPLSPPDPDAYVPDDQEGAGDNRLSNGHQEEGVNGVNGVNGNNVVTSGDPSAAKKGGVVGGGGGGGGTKDKKIPNDKRTTTPYMTKYERARILGTRALQIRYGVNLWDEREEC